MNERILELAEQAEMYAIEDQFNYHERLKEKFAELIVRECIDIVDAQWEPVLVEKIREHFGVEE